MAADSAGHFPRTALITGASAGIGAAAAAALADEGLRVCLMARREDRLEQITESIRTSTGQEHAAICYAGDVTCEDDRRNAVELAMQSWGRLDVLVNNAGTALAGALEDISIEEARDQFEINALAPLAMMQRVGPIFREQGGGRFINVSSISGVMALPGLGAYAASKYAVEALSDAARREYEPWGITVSIIQPGGITTEIWDRAKADLTSRRQRSAGSPFQDFYDLQLNQMETLMNGGMPTGVVSDAIVHAATAKKPKARYCMPAYCRNRKIVSHLPTGIEDWIIRRYVRVCRPKSGETINNDDAKDKKG